MKTFLILLFLVTFSQAAPTPADTKLASQDTLCPASSIRTEEISDQAKPTKPESEKTASLLTHESDHQEESTKLNKRKASAEKEDGTKKEETPPVGAIVPAIDPEQNDTKTTSPPAEDSYEDNSAQYIPNKFKILLWTG